MKKIFLWVFGILTTIYIGICVALYVKQEKLIFHADKLPANYKFQFNQPFEELTITAKDGAKLDGLLFKADSSKGLVFYLHGNAGMLNTWGDIAHIYTDLHYDIFILDYRGFGKSEGDISSEEQFFSDVQTAYDSLKHRYSENHIVIAGYSIGTGPAAMLASVNHPKRLILLAPYFCLEDMATQRYNFTPKSILRYKFETYKFVKSTQAPVTVFHGDADGVIACDQSIKLKQEFKTGDTLFVLPGQGHGGMNENPIYREQLEKILQ